MNNKREFVKLEMVCCSVNKCIKKADFISWSDIPKIRINGVTLHCPILLCKECKEKYIEKRYII